MKKSGAITIAVMMLAVLSFSLVHTRTAIAGDKVYELNFTTIYMDKHPTVRNAFLPWAKEVEARSRGRIKLTYFNPNTLCPVKDNFDSVVSGVIDIGGQYCGMNPGKFPVSDIMELPMIVPSSEAGSLVTWDLYKQFPEWRNEYKDIKMLWQWASATYQLHTTRKMVKTLDDLKGLKIIGWSSSLLEMLKTLGASPIQIGPTDTYLALQRGMADGVLCPLAPVKSYKISDAARFHTIADLNVGPFWAGINQNVWNELPPDLKQILIDTTGDDLAGKCGQTLDEGAREDADWLKGQGHAFYVLPEAEKTVWLSKLRYMHDNWVEKMQAKGIGNARAILEEAKSLGKQYAQTTGRGYAE
jgi:TRAP-type C4-dicarboxylate transport system substrate-binding protein